MMALDPNDERIRPGLDDLHGREASEQPTEQFPPVISQGAQHRVLLAQGVVASRGSHEIQRRSAPVVGDADISAPAHQERELVDPGGNGGAVQRRLTSRVAGVNLSPLVKEDAEVRFVPVGRSNVQWRPAILVARPDIGAAVKQEFGNARVRVRVPGPK